MTKIAATAIVESGAELADDVIVGPGAIIEGGCELAPVARLAQTASFTAAPDWAGKTAFFLFVPLAANRRIKNTAAKKARLSWATATPSANIVF